MKRPRPRFVCYAWGALLAMVFSALSPALAAAALADRPAALGQMLGIPAQPTPVESQAAHEGHDHAGHAAAHGGHDAPAHDGAPPADPADGSAHRAHGIYCSFCLNPASTAAVLVAPSLLVVTAVAPATLIVEPPRRAAAVPHPFFRSRAPPRFPALS